MLRQNFSCERALPLCPLLCQGRQEGSLSLPHPPSTCTTSRTLPQHNNFDSNTETIKLFRKQLQAAAISNSISRKSYPSTMSFTTVEAKKLFFLTADDLHALPRTTLYGGFGTGRASYLFNETDLEAAAIAKYGEAGYAKKVAARQKRLDNKRRREEEAAAAEASFLKSNPDIAAKRRKQEESTKKLVERNRKIQGEKPWNLIMTSPESVAGTKAVLMMKDFPPIGWPDSSYVSCSGDSPANSYGNIHGFKGKSSEEDKEMVFETKWKLWGQRYKGTLRVQVKPSDKSVEQQKDEKDDDEEEPLMVVGKFDSGVNEGVRRWQFKGYR